MDGIGLPMANPVTSLAARAVALTIGPLATQIQPQVTASGLVGIDELVDGLMTNGQCVLKLSPVGDLRGTPLLAEQRRYRQPPPSGDAAGLCAASARLRAIP